MRKRTPQQNKALHVDFRQISDALNDAGLDMRLVLKPGVPIPWTPKSVKEYLWRPIQNAMYQKKSTTELAKQEEIDSIHKTLMRHLGEKFGVQYIPFPSNGVGYWDKAPLRKP